MSYEMKLEQGLSQQLNQFQMQSLNILAFDNYELEQFLQEEFAENPMFDYQPSQKEFFTLHGNAGGYQDVEQKEIEDRTLKNPISFFMEQLNSNDYSRGQWKIMEYMAQCLEESGLLLIPLTEICEKFQISMEECEQIRGILKLLEPAGVFAVNLSECLLLQLERQGNNDENLRYIVEHHLQDIALGHLSVISRKLHISTAQVQKYIFQIQKLNPKPFQGYESNSTSFILPDILMEQEGDTLKISLNDRWIGDYSINDYYIHMMEQADDSELKEYFRKKYERCRWIITSIEQRRETMLKISNAILKRQAAYFIKNQGLKPMTMQDIADDIGMHVSTVSRAVKGKYVQYPGGTISMRDIFVSAYTFGDQEKTSEEIKKEIKALIAKEDKKKPLSDNKIVKKLEEKEIKISRRTVAKYRAQLGIPGTQGRKEYMKKKG